MMTYSAVSDTRRRRRFRPARHFLLAAGLAVLVAACDNPLNVEDIDVARPDELDDPTALPSIRAGAISDFSGAYVGFPSGGGEDGQIHVSGLLGDEYLIAGTFPTRQEIDQRNIRIDNATAQLVFRRLQRSRVAAEEAADAYVRLGPNQPGHAEVLNLAGFSYVFFAENYCSGVPFSRLNPDDSFDFGPPETTRQILEDRALARFDEAIAVAAEAGGAAGARQLNIAYLGKARVLLNLGRFEEAAAVAAEVPTDFVYVVEHSANSTRQNNGIWSLTWNVRRYTVVDNEAGVGLDFMSSNDPRTRVAAARPGFRTTVLSFPQLKYTLRDSSVPVATGLEARLIEAEAAWNRGDFPEMVAIHDALRASPPPTGITFYDYDPDGELGPLQTDGLTPDELLDVHFRERAFWLWQTSHRLGDMRRLVGFYGRPENTVFPNGTYIQGINGQVAGFYGPDMNLPIPIDELNNPQFQQCLNRNAWDLS